VERKKKKGTFIPLKANGQLSVFL